MTREELKQYIDNCILLGNLVNENSEIYKTIHDNSVKLCKSLLKNLLGSVYIDGLYVKIDQEGYIHLVYYDGEYETLDLGDCIDIIDTNAFTPTILVYIAGSLFGPHEVKEYHWKRRNLVSVSGSSVIYIDDGAFQASHVKEVNFPNVAKIGYQCFKEAKVEHISFNKITDIPRQSFLLSSLKSFEGKNVKCISRGAFESCHNLTQVYLPSATIIEETAFKDCKNLHKANIIIKEGVTY